MSEEIGRGTGSREPGMDPTITLEMYNEKLTELAEWKLRCDHAAELLRSVPGPMHPTTYDQYWQDKVEQWLKDVGLDKP